MKLERSGPAVHGVPGHKQRLQLLVSVRSVLVDLCQAVVDAAADVGGQGGEQVIVFCRGLPDVGSVSSFDAILDANKGSFTKECGLEVDCNRVQERACAKAGSTLCRSTCKVIFENLHVGC